MSRQISDIDCRQSLYKNVLPNVLQQMRQSGRKVTIKAVYQALHRGDEEVELLFWKEVDKAETEAEERRKEIAALRAKSHTVGNVNILF